VCDRKNSGSINNMRQNAKKTIIDDDDGISIQAERRRKTRVSRWRANPSFEQISKNIDKEKKTNKGHRHRGEEKKTYVNE